MTDLVVWLIVGSSIGCVAGLVMRMDAQRHAAQYRRGRLLARSWHRA